MKKLMLVLLLLMVTGVLFVSAEIIIAPGVGYSWNTWTPTWTGPSAGDPELQYAPEGVSFNLTTYFGTQSSEQFGYGLLSDLTLEMLDGGEIKNNEFLPDQSRNGQYELGYGADLILGPGINYEWVPGVSILTGLGLHFGFIYIPSDAVGFSDINRLGVGVGNVTRLHWNFTPNFAMMAGFDVAYDLFGYVSGVDPDGVFTGFSKIFSVTPVVMFSITQ